MICSISETEMEVRMSEAETAPASGRRGKPWTGEEDRMLYDGFVAGESLDGLALLHKRGKGGIRSRLQKMRLIDRFGEVVDPPPPFKAPERKRAAKPEVAPVPPEDTTMRPVFSMTAPDGWQVEIHSNRSLDKGQAERLAWILRGAAKPPAPVSQ
jgi:hypothetical protein